MHQIAPFKKKLSGGMPPNPPSKAQRDAQYIPQAGCIFLPNIIPPMFEHGFTPLPKGILSLQANNLYQIPNCNQQT